MESEPERSSKLHGNDLISRQVATQTALEFIVEYLGGAFDEDFQKELAKRMNTLSSAQSETCEGCKHLGKWENEVEYGCSSPCTCCKRRVEDHYER